jgi:hypothetical protein
LKGILKQNTMQKDKSKSNGSSPSLKEEIALKREKKLLEEQANCTFAPALTAPREGRDSTLKALTGSRFDHLYNDALKRKTKGQQAKESEEILEKKADENNFKPAISPKARSISRDRKPSDLVNSLYNASGAGRAIVKDSPKDANLFKPTIIKRANSTDRVSLVDTGSRLYESRLKHQANLEKDKEEAEKRNAKLCTFAPKIFKCRSASLTPLEGGKAIAVTDRLLQYGEKSKTRLEEEKKIREKKELAAATFQPTLVAKKTTNLTPKGASDDIDVYARLASPLEKKQEKEIATFQPTLVANQSKKNSLKGINGDDLGVFARLACPLEKPVNPFADYTELTFKPKTNVKSPRGTAEGETISVHERLFKLANLQKELQEEEVRSRFICRRNLCFLLFYFNLLFCVDCYFLIFSIPKYFFNLKKRLAQEEEARKYSFSPNIPKHRNSSDSPREDAPTAVFERLNSSRDYMQSILSQVKLIISHIFFNSL